MVCMGSEPRTEGWLTQMNPLSYGGPPLMKKQFIFTKIGLIWEVAAQRAAPSPHERTILGSNPVLLFLTERTKNK